MAIHELFAYICVKDARKAVDFYRTAFGAQEKFRLTEPGGRVGHVEVEFGSATLMVSEEYPECGITAPAAASTTSCTLHIHVDDADAVSRRAIDAGASLEMAPQDQFYGERSGVIRDPFGHRWNVGHSIEKIDPAEMQRRYDRLFAGSVSGS